MTDHVYTRGHEHYLFIARRWGSQAESNVETWGMQSPALILLAMMEEMGEIAEELRAEAYGPRRGDGVGEEAARLLREIEDLGLETQDWLEMTFAEPAGEDAPDEDRPVDHCGVGPITEPAPVAEELSDLSPLCFQMAWALDDAADTETERDQ